MFKIIILGTIAAIAASQSHPINEDIVKEIKEKATSWYPQEVHENPLANLSVEEIQGLLGTLIDTSKFRPVNPNEIISASQSFDSRTQWPGCIHDIRNQLSCGSCWAFGATEAFSDRICIATGGKTNVVLSPQDLVSCDDGDMGCNGGWLSQAWSYLKTWGTVTDECTPYVSGGGVVPKCSSTCADGTDKQKYHCGALIELNSITEIQDEIQNNGPMETGFTVYADFMSYSGGIYEHVTGGVRGGHAVKIVGWGVEGGINYWICANSWGTSWGEEGFFRIKMGECGIDQDVWACTPQVSQFTQ